MKKNRSTQQPEQNSWAAAQPLTGPEGYEQGCRAVKKYLPLTNFFSFCIFIKLFSITWSYVKQ